MIDTIALVIVILGGYLLIGFVVALGFCRTAALGDPDTDVMRWRSSSYRPDDGVTLPTGQDDDADGAV